MATKYFWATTATGASGEYLWSYDNGGAAGGNWYTLATHLVNTTKPADTDAFSIIASNPAICYFDEDQSLWAGMAASTIDTGSTLRAYEVAAAYCLKMNADLTNNSTFQIGTSVAVQYPATCTFTLNFSAGSNSIVNNDTTGKCYFYCNEPTNRYVKISPTEAVGQTILSVLTNVTGDIWAVGDAVAIIRTKSSDYDYDTVEYSTIAAGGIAAGTITINNALTIIKEAGSYIVLINRNIKVLNTTDYAFKNGTGHYIACELYSCTNGLSTIRSSTFGGVMAGGSILFGSCNNCVLSGITAGPTIMSQVSNASEVDADGCVIGGAYTFSTDISGVNNGLITSQRYAINESGSCINNGTIEFSEY
jgi:hypothetical protein